MSRRPPWRRCRHDNIGRRAHHEPEGRGRSRLVGVDASHLHGASGTDLVECAGILRRVDGRLEGGVAARTLQHEDALARRSQDRQQLRVDAHQLGVAVGSDDRPGGHANRHRHSFRADEPEHRVAEHRLTGTDRGKAGDFDHVAGLQRRGLLGLDADAARRVLHVDDVAYRAEHRAGRIVAHRDGACRHVANDEATDANAAVGLGGIRIGEDVADRLDGQRERVRRRLKHLHVGGAAGEQRDADQLLGRTEDGADVAAYADAGVDEALEIADMVIPERGTDDDAVFERHVGEHDVRVARRQPGAADDTAHLHVFAVVSPRHQ